MPTFFIVYGIVTFRFIVRIAVAMAAGRGVGREFWIALASMVLARKFIANSKNPSDLLSDSFRYWIIKDSRSLTLDPFYNHSERTPGLRAKITIISRTNALRQIEFLLFLMAAIFYCFVSSYQFV